MAIIAFRGMKPFPQLLFSAFVILACFMAFFVVSLIIAIPFFGLSSIMDMPNINNLGNPESIVILKYFQTVQAIGLFILPPLILGYLFQGSIKEYLYLNKYFNLPTLLLLLVLMFAMAPFINFLGEMNGNMSLPDWMSGVEQWMRTKEDNANLITKAFLKVEKPSGLAFNLFMVALLPAIGEELLFRGVVQKIFTRMTKNVHWGIWISATLFSAMHVQFFGFVPRLLLGALFGYLLIWSGSMWLPILGHFINNAFAVIVMYFIDKGTITPVVEEFGSTSESYYAAFLSLTIVVFLLWLIKKQNSGKEIIARNIVN